MNYQTESISKIKLISNNLIYILIQCTEKYFLKFISPQNYKIFNEENIQIFLKECIEYISKLNANIIENKLHLSNKLQLFKQCIAI